MITIAVLQRVFHLKCATGSGTCFTIDVDHRQYLITAQHIAGHLTGTTNIDLFHDKKWKTLTVTVVSHCPTPIDISVLAPSIVLSPPHDLPPSSHGVVLGQDMYFLGFPYGLKSEVGATNREFPLPFVKGCLLSSLGDEQGTNSPFYLDGHNNPGFSGGPVVFAPPANHEPWKYQVAGVISAYRTERTPVSFTATTNLATQQNTGIIIAYPIEHAVEAIKANPIGVPIPNIPKPNIQPTQNR